MKRYFAIFLSAFIVFGLCGCRTIDSTHPTEDEADGLVTASMLTKVTASCEDTDGNTTSYQQLYEYDEDYNIISYKAFLDDKLEAEITYDKDIDRPLLELEYDKDGQVKERNEYTYDAKGNCLEHSNSTVMLGVTTTTKYVRTYDSVGNVLTEKRYTGNTLEYETRYTYTADGKLLTEIGIADGSEEYTEERTYDEYGNPLTVSVDGQLCGSREKFENTYENGKLEEVKSYEDGSLYKIIQYDSEGNETLVVKYDTDNGEEWYRQECTYENGRLVEEKYYDDGVLEDITRYEYDEMGRLVKEMCYENGKVTLTTGYSYNADGDIAEVCYTDSDGGKLRFAYDYNGHGDVISMKLYDEDRLSREYTWHYEAVRVSKDTAKKLEAIASEHKIPLWF